MVLPEDLGSCLLVWKTQTRMHGCKWGLLKVREREIQRRTWWGTGGVCLQREYTFLFSGAFKTFTIHGEGGRRRFPPNNE
jgi:hypothetical protein